MTILTKITLDQIASGRQIRDMVEESPAMSSAEYAGLPQIIVERIDGRLSIVDGFHRAAGLARWASDESMSLREIEIEVAECDDADLLAAAGEPSERQQVAIDAIYAMIA